VHLAEPIFNLSDRLLSGIERGILSKGLKLNLFEILARFEEFAQTNGPNADR
jgi:hypothetical protein